MPATFGSCESGTDVARRIGGPREALRERLVVAADVSPDRRCGVRLHVADAAISIQVEVHHRRAGDVTAVIDEVLCDAVEVRPAGDRVLQLSASFDAERPDEVVAAAVA